MKKKRAGASLQSSPKGEKDKKGGVWGRSSNDEVVSPTYQHPHLSTSHLSSPSLVVTFTERNDTAVRVGGVSLPHGVALRVAVREAPKPPAERITLTRPVINSARCVWLVVSGSDKAAALGLALAGASYETVPAAGAKGRKRTLFFVDEAAAVGVPPELIDQDF